MKDRCWLEVHAQALRHNIQTIQESIGRSKIMAVVKDNCYGIGMDAVYFLQEAGIDFFAVSCLDEAIELRNQDIYQPILIFGYTHPDNFSDLVTYDLIQTAISVEYLLEMNQYSKNIKCHLKINTGMNRLGLPLDYELIKKAYLLEGVDIVGIYTHLLSADQPEKGHEKSLKQLQLFDELLAYLELMDVNVGTTHVLNSAGIYYFGESHQYDYVRPGLLLASSAGFSEYQEIIEWKARVAMVKDVSAGENVGYGIENVLEKDTQVATVTVGYGDGLSRQLGSVDYRILVKGHARPMLGRICMDQLLLDVTGVDVHVGDMVSLIHDDFTVMDMALLLETIPNEILTQIGHRVKRVLVYDEENI